MRGYRVWVSRGPFLKPLEHHGSMVPSGSRKELPPLGIMHSPIEEPSETPRTPRQFGTERLRGGPQVGPHYGARSQPLCQPVYFFQPGWCIFREKFPSQKNNTFKLVIAIVASLNTSTGIYTTIVSCKFKCVNLLGFWWLLKIWLFPDGGLGLKNLHR